MIILYVWLFSMYTPCMAGVHGEQNKALHPPELELQMVVSHLLILGTKPASSARAVSAITAETSLHFPRITA